MQSNNKHNLSNNQLLEKFSLLWIGAVEAVGKSISGAGVSIIWDQLKKYHIDDIERAVYAHLSDPDNGCFMITASHVVKFIEGSGDTRSTIAWTKVFDAMSSVGGYRSIVFDDPLIHHVIQDMGGWIYLCNNTKIDREPFVAKEFKAKYETAIIKKPRAISSVLRGMTEMHNMHIDDAKIEKPILFGDKQKAIEVMNDNKTRLSLKHELTDDDVIKSLNNVVRLKLIDE